MATHKTRYIVEHFELQTHLFQRVFVVSTCLPKGTRQKFHIEMPTLYAKLIHSYYYEYFHRSITLMFQVFV